MGMSLGISHIIWYHPELHDQNALGGAQKYAFLLSFLTDSEKHYLVKTIGRDTWKNQVYLG